MLRILSIILIVILVVSCTSRTIYKKPDDLIAKDQMIDLWTDIYIANSARAVKNKKLERKVNYMPFIYEKYQIDSARFMRSNIYYTSKIETYEEMFQKVEARLKGLRDTYDPDMAGVDQKLPIWERDSIRKARKRLRKEQEEDAPIELLEKKASTIQKKKVKE